MLRILGNRTTACDGTTRREVLRAGGLSLFGTMTLPRLLAGSRQPGNQGRAPGRARSIILLNLFGGPSHLDMFDMKPKPRSKSAVSFVRSRPAFPGFRSASTCPGSLDGCTRRP